MHGWVSLRPILHAWPLIAILIALPAGGKSSDFLEGVVAPPMVEKGRREDFGGGPDMEAAGTSWAATP